MREVGALLEARTYHPGRSAANHLAALAAANGIPRARVRVVLDTVGLADVANKRTGGFSLGMSQRLGSALGAVVRHTAAAVGLLYVLPAALSGLTGVAVAKFFPTMIAGNSLAVSKPVADVLSPWVGFEMLCACTWWRRSARTAGC